MLINRLLATAFVLCLTFMTPSFAQTAPPAGQLRLPDIKQVPLTADKVQRLIKSMPAMQAFGKKHQLSKLPKGAPNDPDAALMQYLKTNNLTDKLQSLLGSFGFGGIQEWTQVMQSTTLAYGFARSGKSATQMKNEMQNMIARLQADPNMPQDQKANLIAMFKSQMAMALKMTPPPGNIEIVRKMMPQIEQAMKRK